ncbi:hypothetical protein ACFLS9_00835 [Bacteroidota bacterium]
MTPYFYIILIISIPFIVYYIRFKLTKWGKVVELFKTIEEPKGKVIYGFYSEFHHLATIYPLGNNFLKLIPSFNGLYLKYDLKYEIIKFYTPVYIPWENIEIEKSSDRIKYDKYYISFGNKKVGTLFLQPFVTEKIENNVERFKLNFI